MQPEEMRAIRKQLGLTLVELGDVLGLTGPFIGAMENGHKPIEPRTRLSLLYLADHPEAARKG